MDRAPRLRIFSQLALFVFALFLISSARATVLYVKPDGAGGAGTSWATAFDSLSAAIAAANPTANNPVEIWIAKGTYKPGTTRDSAFRLKSHLMLRGGFRGDETVAAPRQPWGNPTVLSGDIGVPMIGAITDLNPYSTQAPSTEDAGWADNCYNVIIGDGVTNVVLEYLTITGGSATNAGVASTDIDGYVTYSANPATPGANSTVKPSSTVIGGGLYLTSGGSWTISQFNVQLLGCTFIRNRARGFGGAVGLYDASAWIDSCEFTQNVSDGSGGAFWGSNQQSAFAFTKFTDNTAKGGGGAVTIRSIPSFRSSETDIDKIFNGIQTIAFAAQGAQQAVDEAKQDVKDRISKSLSEYEIFKRLQASDQAQGDGLFKSVAEDLINKTGVTRDDVKLAVKTIKKAKEIKDKAVEIKSLGGLSSLKSRPTNIYAIVKLSVEIGDIVTEILDSYGLVDHNNPHYQNWNTFSVGFKKYATPEGLIKLWYEDRYSGVDMVTPQIMALKKNALKNYYTQAGRSGFGSCTFSGNETDSVGGAIELVFNNLVVESCTFTDNRAVSDGAAIASSVYSMPQLISSLFSNNFSDQGTSAISASTSSLMMVTNCTIINNTSFDKEGVAVSATMGGDVRLYNSILWANASATKTKGADVLAVTRDMMDEATRTKFDALVQGQQANWVGIMDIRNSIVQSLKTIPLGTDKLSLSLAGTNIDQSQIDWAIAVRNDADAIGELEGVGAVNAGSGVRPKLRDPAYGNSDADPLLLAKPLGKPSRKSPAYNAGNDRWATGRLIAHATVVADIRDVANVARVGNSRVDIGAFEIDPSKPDEFADLAGQAVGGDADAPVATGVGAGSPPVISAVAAPGTTIYYVMPTASGNGSGSSWANATADLKSAMNHANAEVWVAAGTYTPGASANDAFAMADGVKIFGGFVGNETARNARNWRNNRTTISGEIGAANDLTDNSKNLFRNVNVSNSAVLDGFTLEYAYSLTSDGGAILNTNSAPLIQNCVFRNNRASNGGAIYSSGTNAVGSVLVNCEFRDNRAEAAGGAVRYTHALFGNNLVFSGNQAVTGGGAVSVAGSSATQYCTIQNGLFYNNSSTGGAGGAISSRGLYLNVQNSTFYANSAAISSSTVKAAGGAIDHAFTTAVKTASAVVLNSIFYKNTATNSSTGGIETLEKRQIQIPDPLLLSHSLVQGLNTYVGGPALANFDGDPLFVTEGTDFHLQAQSLAVDAGDSSDVYSEVLLTDLEGNKRPFSFAIDLGPYEKSVVTPAHLVTTVAQFTAGAESYTFSTNYLTKLGDMVQWYVDRGDGLGFVALVEDAKENVGVKTDTLTVLSAPNGFTYRLQVTRSGVTYISPTSKLRTSATSPYRFVKPVATGEKDGSSWADAMDLQSALNSTANAEFWVAEGTYRPTAGSDREAYFSLNRNRKMYGGFVINQMKFEQRDWRAHPTIISGEIGGAGAADNSRHLWINTNVSSASILDGFYFQGAYGDGVDGGAMVNITSSPVFSNCVFKGNYARNGGAISSRDDDSSPRFLYCEFEENTAEVAGGAIYFKGQYLAGSNLRFKDNKAQRGGAVHTEARSENGGTGFTNSLFVGNQALGGFGGAVFTAGSSLSVTNCTFFGNRATINSTSKGAGGAVYFSESSDSFGFGSLNSIFYKNTAVNEGAGGLETVEKQQVFMADGFFGKVRYTLIQGLDIYTQANGYDNSTTNLDGNPQFVAEGTDFHLAPGSLAIDIGENPAIFRGAKDLDTDLLDLAGDERVRGLAIDLGAYESPEGAANPLRSVTYSSGGMEYYVYSAQFTPQANDQLKWFVDRGDGAGMVPLGTYDPGNQNLPQEYFGIDTATLTILSPPSGYRFQLRLTRQGVDYFSPLKQLRPTIFSKSSYIYVRPTATGDGSGSGWTNATSDLQAALSNTGAQVWVQEGTYYPTTGTDRDKAFAFVAQGVKVYGGFKGGESLRDARKPALNITRISGAIGGPGREDNSRHLFKNTSAGGSLTVLDGFTLEDAYADGEDGGAVQNIDTTPTFQNCVFQNNYARNGGALYSGGVEIYGSMLVNCTFKNNTAEVAGGAIYYKGIFDAVGVIFEGNQAAKGGAAYVERIYNGQSCAFKNTLFFNNRALAGNGGAICSEVSVTASSSTFYGNQVQFTSASKLGGGAIYIASDNRADVVTTNSIYYGNIAVNPNSAGGLDTVERQQIVTSALGHVFAQNSLIQGLNEYANTAAFANFDEAPGFVNPDAGNFRLTVVSPAVNAGTATGYTRLTDTDLDGKARIVGGVADLGPYENTTASALGRVLASTDFTGGVAQFIRTANVAAQPGDVLRWYVQNSSGVWVPLNEDAVYSGVNTAVLKITAPSGSANGTLYRLQVTRGSEILLTLPTQLTLPPETIYVDAARIGLAGDGRSWSTAYADLQRALKASGPGSTIMVAAGTYYPTTGTDPLVAFEIPAGVTVYGGLAAGFANISTRNFAQNPSILSGRIINSGNKLDYSRHVVWNRQGQGRTTVLDGFVLQDSFSSLVLNDGASPTIRNCFFRDNDNSRSDGSAVAIANINSASPLIAECQFLRNTASGAGVVSMVAASATIENCVFAQNVTGYNAAVVVESGTLNLVHCTVVDNNATTGNVAGLFARDSTVTVANSIFWSNRLRYTGVSEFDQAIRTPGTAITFQSSCIQGGTSLPATNVATDPLFDAPTGTVEYALAPYSPLVNAGSASYTVASTKDIAGKPRSYGAQPDMGAYELQRAIVAPLVLTSLPRSRTVFDVGGSVDFTVTWSTANAFTPVWEVWQVINGQNVAISASRYSIIGGTPGLSTLRLSNLTLDDSGIKVTVKAFYYDDVTAQTATLYTPPATLTVRLPRIVRVNPAATGIDDGTSWPTAYRTLTTALQYAEAGDEIWVAKGTYTAGSSGYFQLQPTVSLYGGFSGLGTETARSERNITANPTILRPVGTNPVLYGAARDSQYGLPSVLDGFTVENGAGSVLVYNNAAYAIYRNCVFRNNTGWLINSQSSVQYDRCEFTGHSGTLLSIDRSTLTVTDSSIHHNTTAVDLITASDGTAVTFSDVTVSNNTVAGALFRNGSGSGAALTVLRSAFRANSTGGAVIANGSAGTVAIESSLFAKNTATGDMATLQNGGTLSLILSTVADNSGGSFGGGLATYVGSVSTVDSSIIWGSRGTRPGSTLEAQQLGDSRGTSGAGALSVKYSTIEGLTTYVAEADRNEAYHPLFVNPDAGDYHVTSYSPPVAFRGAGSFRAVLSASDLDKVARIGNGGAAGAYEFVGTRDTPLLVSSYPVSVATAETTGAGFTYTGQGSVQWQYFDGSTWINITANTSEYRIISVSGNPSTSTLFFDSPAATLNGRRFRLVLTQSGNTHTTPELVLTVNRPRTIYVNGGVIASGDGNSWATAYKTVQEALAATDANCEIWVQAGRYSINTANLKWGVHLYGGFAGTETLRAQRNWTANEVTLFGGGKQIFSNYDPETLKTSHAVLDGFTLTGSTSSSSISLTGSDAAISNCTFRGNARAIETTGRSNPVIANCLFEANTSTVLSLEGDTATISGSTFKNNTNAAAVGSGPVIYVYRGTVTVSDSKFTGNVVSGGLVFANGAEAVSENATRLTMTRCEMTGNTAYAGVYTTAVRLDLNNSLIAQNTLTSSAVRGVAACYCTLMNVTIADNTGTFESVGVQVAAQGQYTLKNSIVWGNRTPVSYLGVDDPARIETMQIKLNGGSTLIQNSQIEGAYLITFGGNPNGNSGYDPLFADSAAGKYQLTAISPAVQQDGSIGAYQFTGVAGTRVRLITNLNARTVVTGLLTKYSVQVPTGVSVQWQVKTGSTWTNVVTGGNQTLSADGSLLTISNLPLSMTGTEYRFVLSGDVSYTSAGRLMTVVAKPRVYVNAAATGANNGSTWANAYTSLTDALNAAADPLAGKAREIWVAQGSYMFFEDGLVSPGMEIYGGFTGTESALSERNVVTHPTILTRTVPVDRVTSYYLLTGGTDSDNIGATIDGFTLTGTTSGLYSYGGPLVVRNCTFSGLSGYGVLSFSRLLTVEDCTFGQTGEVAIYSAATVTTTNVRRSLFQGSTSTSVVSDRDSTVTIEDSVFRDNTPSSRYDSSVIYVSEASTVNVTRSRFLKNNVYGAIYNSGRFFLRQSLIAGNFGRGVAVNFRAQTTHLTSVTVADNTSAGIGFIGTNSSLRLTNSILAGNKFAQIADASGGLSISYTLTQGVTYGGSGNMSWDPIFVNPAAGDYTLASRSPGINAGTLDAVNAGETDLAGAARIQSGAPDLGAYESANAANPLYRSALPTSLATTRGVDAVFSITGASTYTYTWQYYNGSAWVTITYNSTSGLWEGPSGIPVNITTSSGVSTLTVTSPPLSANGLQVRLTINGEGVTTDPLTLTVSEPEIMYVDGAVATSGDGKTWGTAFKTLAEAVARVIQSRRIIYVAKGTYTAPSNGYEIGQRVEIYGGFPAGGSAFGARNPAVNPVILSGELGDPASAADNAAAVLRLSALNAAIVADTVIEGLTLDAGRKGVSVESGARPTLRNLIASHNAGAGLDMSAAGGRVENCQFLENSAGGAVVSGSIATFVGCSFRGNTRIRGAGIAIFNGAVRMESVVVSGNRSDQEGGGIEVQSGSHVLVNSTVVGNYANDLAGGGGLYAAGGGLAVWNSIIWANRSPTTSVDNPNFQISVEAQQLSYALGAGFNVQKSVIEGLANYGTAGNNLGLDPLFYTGIAAASAPTTTGDFHVYGSSPAVDAGDNALLGTTTVDADNVPRLVRTVDLGAYEFQGSASDPLIITQQPADLVQPVQTGLNQFQVVLVGTNYLIQWESSPNGSVFTPVVNGPNFAGAQTATLQVLKNDPTLSGIYFRAKITGTAGGSITTRSALLTVYPTQYYVNGTAADDTGDGYTWATAFKTLGTALAKVRVNPAAGVQVWVAAGTYVTSATDAVVSFPLKSQVEIYGGFIGTETALTQRNSVANPTTLKGIAGSSAVFSFSGTTVLSGVRIDGFAINTASAGISMAKNVTLTVANCSFSGLATGIAGDTDTVTVQNCQFTGMSTAGIANHFGTTTVADSVFSSSALGIWQGYGVVNVARSAFRGNGVPTAEGGGLKLNDSVGVTLQNCLFSGNYAQVGSGFYATRANVNVQNCTFAGNYAAGAAGIYFQTGGISVGLQITNSIFWGNDISGPQAQFSQVYYDNPYSSDRPFYNNNIQRLPGSYTDYDFLSTKGNISVDPQFKAPVTATATATTAGDYRLTALSSGVINKGANTYLGSSTTDLAQSTRTVDTTVDLGAYEFQSVLVAVTTQPLNATAGIGNEMAVFSVASNSAEASYQWQVSTDGGSTWTDLVASANQTGVTTATLTISGGVSFDGRYYRAKVTSPDTSTYPGVAFSTAAQYRFASVAVTPPSSVRNATLTGASSTISFNVTGGALAASIVDGSFAVHAMQTGRLSLADGSLTGLTVSGATVSLQSAVPFKPGELVAVSTTSAVQRTDGFYSLPLVYQFRAGNLGSYGAFLTASAITGAPATARALANGDLNGNGSIDLVVGGTSGAAVWLNNGTGSYTSTGQTLGSGTVSQVLLGSLGLTGSTGSRSKLDIVLRKSTGDVEIWRNEGNGSFTNTSTITGVAATSLGLADLNGDGALDLFIATAGADQVWFNNGAGAFTDSTQRLGTGSGMSVAFGDYNNDNTLDVFTANGSGSVEIWSNDGAGHFTAGPTPTSSAANRVITADFDRDGRLDFVIVRDTGQIRIYRQATNGAFNFTTQTAPVGVSVSDPTVLSMGDVDGDGFPDLVFTTSSTSTPENAIQVWRGQGYSSSVDRMDFQLITEQPALNQGRAGDLADINGDGMMDSIFIPASGIPTVALYVAAPAAPTGLIATAASDTQITLTWTDNATNETNYTVERSPNGNNTWTVLSSTLAANSTSYTDTGRNPATTYYYRVRSHVSGILPSSYSNTANVATRAAITAAADAIAVIENATATTLVGGATSVLANDTNPDAGTLAATVVTGPTHGSLTLNADGTFSYTPTAAYSGSDSFTYRATNLTTTASTVGTVSITVTRLNEAPATLALTPVAGVHYTGQTAGANVATLSATDSDPEDAGLLTYSLVSGTGSAGNADFTITGATLKTAVVIDASGGLTRAVRIRVTDTLGLFREDTFTVTFTRAPAAAPASAGTDEDTPVELLLSGAGGATALSYQIVTQPGHGTLVRSTTVTDVNAYTYTPAANYFGSDSFTYRVADSNLTSAAATVTLTIAAVDDAPTLDAIAPVTTVAGTPVSFTLVGRDAEGDAITSYQLVGTPTLGTVQLSGAVVTYTPNLNTIGTETVSFTVTAGGKTSAVLPVAVTITPVPVAALVYRGLYEYIDIPAATSGDWTGVVPVITAAPARGSVTFDGTRLRYAHHGGTETTDGFTYTLTNSANDVRTIAVAVTIKDWAIAVTSNADSGANTLREALATVARFASDTLAPGHTTAAAWAIQIQLGAGQFIRTTTFFTDTPANGFSSAFQVQGNVTIDAAASPGFILTIQQSSPYARNVVVPVGSSLTLKNMVVQNGRANSNGFFTSTGGLVLNFGTFIADHVTFKGGQANTGSAIYNNGGTVALTDCSFLDNFFLTWPDTQDAIVASRNGSLTLTRVTFGDNLSPELYVLGAGAQATVNVSASTIGSFLLATSGGGTLATTGLPRPANDTVEYLVGQSLTIDLATLLANDLGTSAASLAVDGTTSKGVTLTRTGNTLTYQPSGGVTDSDSFTYTVTDAAGLKATATVNLTFKVPSTAPVGNADTATAYRGLATTIDVLANDTQPLADTMTITAVTAPTRGTATITANGTRILYTQYDTVANQTATTDSFTYTVSNSTGTTANVPVAVTISDRVIHANNGANNGAGTIRAALAFIDGYREAKLAPANTTAPDWTIKIFAFPNETWYPDNDSPGSYSGDLTSYRIHSKVTIDASESSNFSLQSPVYQNFYHVRTFAVDSGASLTLKNLSLDGAFYFPPFEGGFTVNGGAVINSGTFIADHVNFKNQTGNAGAAIFNDGGTVALTDCSFTGNTFPFSQFSSPQGIVYSRNGSLSFTRVTFADQGMDFFRTELYVASGGTTALSFTETAVPSYRFDGGVTGIARVVNDRFNRAAGSPLQISAATLLTNDDGPARSIVSVSGNSAFGFGVSLANGVITYDTNAGYLADDDAFDYTITDSAGFTATGTVFIHTNINTAPTLAAIANRSILQNAAAQTVSLTGITAGTGETQGLTITATSDNQDLIPDPTVTYTSANPTGTLAFTPAANASGVATITVTVQDDGGTENDGHDYVTRTFTVTVTSVNQAPTLDVIDPVALLEDPGTQTIDLTGISAGPGESAQALTITATSGNSALIPNPTVNYTSGEANGTLTFTPAANASGAALITVTLTDNGGTANSGTNSLTRTFTVTVTPVNDAPTLNAITNPAAILEGAGQQTVAFSGITAVGGETSQSLTVTATSDNLALIANPTVTYTSGNSSGTLTYTPLAGARGTAVVTVTVRDNGGTDNGGIDSVSRTFTVTVTPINRAPTLAAITDPTAILEDASQQTIGLTGITAGLGESSQTLTITATSDNLALIPHPTVIYTSGAATGTLTYTPMANASGTALITVTATDNGGVANGGVNTVTRTFTVTVTAVNDAPTLNAITNPTAILEDAGQQTIALGGITAGSGETSQTLTVTATSDNLALIPHPAVTYTSPQATGSLTYTPVANASGTALITVTVTDSGGTANGGVNTVTRTFTVTVTAVNDTPTLDAIANPAAINQDAGQQTIALSGMTAGGGETLQTLTVTATSDTPALIANPTVTYTSPQSTGTLRYTPVAGASGTAIITVRVQDDGGTLNGAVNYTTRTFTVTVNAVDNTPPTLTIAARSGGGVTLRLTGRATTSYVISRSSDLINWSPFTTVTTDSSGSVSVDDTTSPAEGAARFYRAVRN